MNWLMLTLVGEDQPGIVAQVTDALYRGGCILGETSMIRLGGNFSIMMMVDGGHGEQTLTSLIEPVAEQLQLKFHLDPMGGGLHQHRVPNFQVRVNGADRAGIVAKVTGALAECGFNILELASDVVGDSEKPVYIMTIQGYAESEIEALESALRPLAVEGIDVHVSSIETLIG
ncbi:MAG: amino acid-binding protein [gamma proteobacterium symbiont of Ctena orbiculata]|uniref:glycine cleavage system protein R n=1 Tax=Candidatus Thiodiazotropha sp. CDECU1 TaxID=3065865 RepID=UPI000D56AC65|nr:ACT domain-containing protein [Candidatus Thiodiazotropha sp. CDECU1]PVV10693.1 MAG: amino acid-binding protein [gamma proteobacterium symbiont of Ctena orbiculata]PVV21824.1 MAG: amino acid-binding protein [gamma proteobacterium symbiont of Ctena orbiculata]PVV25909.1 MAG: amino acid-binding protein [gamma proteobacterium symbiont of Ctena orbiculata]